MAIISEGNAVQPNRLAAVSVAILGGYLQVVEWIDLYPWNDVRTGNGQETLDLILAGATIVLILGLWFFGRAAASVAAAALAAWIYLQAVTWWVPYFQGASPGWRRVYEKWFADTINILPRTEDKLPPDANHLTLHLLLLLAFALCLLAVFRRSRQ